MQGVNADVCHSLCMLVEAVAEGISLHTSSRRMYVLLPQNGFIRYKGMESLADHLLCICVPPTHVQHRHQHLQSVCPRHLQSGRCCPW